MKNLFKIITLSLAVLFSVNSSFAISISKLDRFVRGSKLNDTSTIAISVRNADSGSVVYESNEKKLLHPASTLKVFSLYAALEELGYDYNFKTQFYKSGNDLYIKLGADPMLTTAQLKSAFKELKNKGQTSFKNLYFDDSIIDKKEFSQGWMWDDDISPYTPKVSSYNLDGNVIAATLSPSANGMMSITTKSKYPMSVIGFIKSDKVDYIDMNRYNWSNPEVVEIYGLVNKTKSFNIPISSMRRYFIYNIEQALDESKIQITSTKYASKLLPDNAKLLTQISNPIARTIAPVLQNSNNLMAETIYKVAASKKYTSTGTDLLAGELFTEFYQKQGLDTNSIIIKDGCGVSRNNLFDADWMTSALSKLYKDQNFETFKESMAQAGDGTLSKRLYDLRGEAWLKTGSLSNISAITGYVKSQDGHTYAVALLIQNFKQNQSEIKQLEDEIIQIIYDK